MGVQFFWIYDIAVVAIIVAMAFVGSKNGFVKMIFGFISVILAFLAAMWLSDFLAEKIYVAAFEEKIEQQVDATISEAVDGISLAELSELDFDKITVGGVAISELELSEAGTGKVSLELSDVDMSKTGIEKVDLSLFGLNADNTDFTSMKIGTVELKKSDIKENGLGKMIVAQALAESVQNVSVFNTIKRYSVALANVIPSVISETNENIQSGDNQSLSQIFLTMINTKESLGDSITSCFIRPIVTITIRTIVFIVVFIIASIILMFIAKGLSAINKIPLIGGVNMTLGGVLGIVQGLLTVAVVCIVVRMIIAVSDNTLIFLNDETISETYVFNYLYNFKFLIFG